MDNIKTGRLIYSLRKEKGYTQLQLAQKMNISDKTISKWERGQGCPDVSLLQALSDIFGVDIEKLLSGELNTNPKAVGNMRKTGFYICPECGNIVTAIANADISCCGKKLYAVQMKKADENEKLDIDITDNNYVVTSGHPMTRSHNISFVALLTADSIIIRKQYPEWDMLARFQYPVHGRLVWYCTQHGLFYQELNIR